MNVTIIGLGLIGGSFAKDLRAEGFASHIFGVDENSLHGQQAMELGLVESIESLESALKKAELVILAIPVNAIAKLLPKVLDLVDEKTVVTDAGSTKMEIIKTIESHPKRSHYVASHPMAGTEYSGPQAALRGLFKGRTAVICDASKSKKEHLGIVERMYKTLKMRLIYMSSSEHDLHTAYISHLSHISSFVLANTVLDIEKDVKAIFDLASGGFESTVRLAKSSPTMWSPIFQHNHQNILKSLDAYINHLTIFREKLAQHKTDDIIKIMENANQIRRVLEQIQHPQQGKD